MLYDELKQVDEDCKVRTGGLTKKRVEEMEREMFEAAQKEIIEKHAKKCFLTDQVVRGENTYLEVGRPIIEKSESLEIALRGKRFARVRKSDILGVDGRDQKDVGEIVSYLAREKIIDPNHYFSSYGIFPERLGRVLNVPINQPLLFGSSMYAGIVGCMIAGWNTCGLEEALKNVGIGTILVVGL